MILLDIEMPELDGFEVLAALKGDAELQDIPVVFLTSRSGITDVVAGLRGGAHDYLKKPFEHVELVARVGSAVHVKKLQDQLRQRNADLDRMSRTDALTGLYNRRHLDEQLGRQQSNADRHHDPLCVLLLDIDHFKKINDSFGHPAGDLVLSAFADRLRSELRANDIVGRWGGEEFLVIMPRTDLAGALEVAERLRARDRGLARARRHLEHQRDRQRRLRAQHGRSGRRCPPTCRHLPVRGQGLRSGQDRHHAVSDAGAAVGPRVV